ncbi:expressed unknown protein [Seminavis robusta]|uniref:Uncharacterized protein n=1 Tax=Seminavis robusta TaxID=568900 RepID=A0A9N8E4U1_9STRA|nr:expressed unknown protein [Seminavis robusta]|eukprot:Sro669_g184540.1 n/a (169) ;mRNA; f:24795-25301
MLSMTSDFSHDLHSSAFQAVTTDGSTTKAASTTIVPQATDSPTRLDQELALTTARLMFSTRDELAPPPPSLNDMTTRRLSLDSARDHMLLLPHHQESSLRRTWTIPADVPSEQSLRERRSLCESLVQRLYEDRKERILEIFQHTWLLTDTLEDDGDDDDDDNSREDPS